MIWPRSRKNAWLAAPLAAAALLAALCLVSLAAAGDRRVAAPAAYWTTLLHDSFESGLGSGWVVTDTNGPLAGEYYWATTAVTTSSGAASLWASGGGADGALLTPLTDNYPPDTAAWLAYGPLDLTGTLAVSLTFDYWLDVAPPADQLHILASTDGQTFTPQTTLSGRNPGWQRLELSLSAFAGASRFWLAFNFVSDDSQEALGVFLDRVLLQALRLQSHSFLPAVAWLDPPTPTPTATPLPVPAWLEYLNRFRGQAALAPLAENSDWSYGGWLHGRYMVKNNYVGHSEDPTNPWYTPEGLAAAQNGNVFVTSWAAAPDNTAINFWMPAPFHAISMLDPQLYATGFGMYRQADGGFQAGATLDVLRGLGLLPPGATFPVPFPGDGGAAWLLSYNGGEFPDPLTACPGYTPPTGPPILLQLGGGALTPAVSDHSFRAADTVLPSCRFDETSYYHPDPAMQSSGRLVLNARDAVVIMPRSPLVIGQQYTASVTANGATTTWSFTATTAPEALPLPPEAIFEIR